MARVVEHLSVAELEARYQASEDVTSSRHFQTIFLLAKGHSTRKVAEITSFGLRWVEQLLERYNAFGRPLWAIFDETIAASRGSETSLLQRLGVRLTHRRPTAVWTSGKVARWMADELAGRLAPQRGWEALKAVGWSIQKPRPRNPKAATAAEQDAFKKKSPKSSLKKPRPIPASRSKRSRPTSIGSD